MERNFDEILIDAYEKTLRIATSLAKNKADITKTALTSNDLKFVKRIAKDYKDFKDLLKKTTNPKKQAHHTESPVSSISRYQKNYSLPKNSGKQKLLSSLEISKGNLSNSKAGRKQKYAETGPNVLEKLKLNSSIYTESSKNAASPRPKLLPHISLRTGKVIPSLELPSFKEYVESERSKDQKDLILDKISNCNKALTDFEKEISGLEVLMNSSTGVSWNNDRKVLMKLNAYPGQKAVIIKAYKDQMDQLGQLVSRKSKISNFREQNSLKFDQFLSKTPNPKPLHEFNGFESPKEKEDPGSVVRRCYEEFRNARDRQNKKLINIMESLSVSRSANLKNKARYILNDSESFKDKLYSIRKMEDIKKKIDVEQKERLKRSKEQSVIYDKMMEFLKKKKGGPSDAEINFLEIFKDILEEGWYIDDSIIEKIIENTSAGEINELGPLIEFLKSELQSLNKSVKNILYEDHY